MKKAMQSPWLTVVLTIIVMSIGYITYMHTSGNIASASTYTCPMQKICNSDACTGNGCTAEGCLHCEGCKNRAS